MGTNVSSLRVNTIIDDSIVDGYGMRCVVFTQGCYREPKCIGCHNPQTWDSDLGYDVPIDTIVERVIRNPLCKGITLSGGEPYAQVDACVALLQMLRERDTKGERDVWIYTGFTFSEIKDSALTQLADYLVTGKFDIDLAYLDTFGKFRGSSNQFIWKREKDAWRVVEDG